MLSQLVFTLVVYCQLQWFSGWHLAKKEWVVFIVIVLGGVGSVSVADDGLSWVFFAFGFNFFLFLVGWDGGKCCTDLTWWDEGHGESIVGELVGSGLIGKLTILSEKNYRVAF